MGFCGSLVRSGCRDPDDRDEELGADLGSPPSSCGYGATRPVVRERHFSSSGASTPQQAVPQLLPTPAAPWSTRAAVGGRTTTRPVMVRLGVGKWGLSQSGRQASPHRSRSSRAFRDPEEPEVRSRISSISGPRKVQRRTSPEDCCLSIDLGNCAVPVRDRRATFGDERSPGSTLAADALVTTSTRLEHAHPPETRDRRSADHCMATTWLSRRQ